MSCSNCSRTKKIISCTTTLTVGTAGVLNTALYLYIESKTTGRVYIFEVTTSAGGLITVDLSSKQFAEGHDYELWCTLSSSKNIDDKINFTIDGEQVNCLTLQFERVFTSATVLKSGVQTLSLAD
jgi:hypothetical protein